MKEHHFETRRTARYYTLGELNDKTESIWFVLHGYMHLAAYFISKFKVLNNGKNFIVAPEALSRAYISGTNGRVGASWMTKEDRETEINDYIHYLNGLYDHIMAESAEGINVNILGFSQGVATAARWVGDLHAKPDHFILWAGVFPPDMQFKSGSEDLRKIKTTVLIGTEDQYFEDYKKEDVFSFLHEHAIPYKLIEYQGGHNIYGEILQELAQN